MDVTVSDEVKMEAIDALRGAIDALLADDYDTFGRKLGSATKTINTDADVPYYVGTTGGLPVQEIGPSVMLPNGHSAFFTLPDAPTQYTPEHDFSINLNDHLHVFVDGERKGVPSITIQSSEFDSKLRVDDLESSFRTVDTVRR